MSTRHHPHGHQKGLVQVHPKNPRILPTRKRISFGDVKIQDIEAENPRPKSKVKAMNAKEADEIFESLKDMGGSGVCSVILVMFSLFTLIIGAYHMSLSP